MTPEEAGLMGRHAVYWQGLADRGVALLAGPVLDPAGPFGLALVEAPDADAARAHTDADPVVEAGIGFRYEIHPIPQAILRASPSSPSV
jgi:uncharacterized protein YciI